MEARSEDEALGMHSVRRHWRQRDAAVVGARHPPTGRLPAIGRQDGASSAMARRPRTRAGGAEGGTGLLAGRSRGRRCTRHGAAPPGVVRS